MNFEFYTYFFVNAFSQAAVTFIGQNYAAGQYRRCDKVMKFCMAASFVSTPVSYTHLDVYKRQVLHWWLAQRFRCQGFERFVQ